MKPSDFQKTVQCRFESCLKKVVRHIVKDYQQGLKRRKDKEIPFCAYSARTAHPFQRNGAPFRFKLSKAQQVD
ncbi:MAG: hypothetical protein ACLR7S_10645 [Dorea longicatena]